jgi:hypothetical protein
MVLRQRFLLAAADLGC